MATAETDVTVFVECVRCAVVAAHPFGNHAPRCPNCGRVRDE